MFSSSAITASLVLVCVILATFVQPGSSLKCYRCTNTDKDCQDEFDSKKHDAVDCSTVSTSPASVAAAKRLGGDVDVKKLSFTCIKVSVKGKNSKDDGVIRDCAYDVKNMCEAFGATLEIGSDQALTMKACNTCSKDECNGAGAITASFAALVAGLFAYVLMQ